MKKIFLSVALSVLLSSFAAAQTTAPASAQTIPASKNFNAERLINDLRILSADEMQGRWVGTVGGLKAREYVTKRFKESGLQPIGDSYLQPFEFAARNGEKLAGANVIGYIKGKKNPEKYIVVSAHYDHVGVRNGKIYNGADDNASGTAALFALANYFSKKRPANSIIFAAFDAEEAGLQGARKFVAEPPVNKESILLNVNMDMIAHNGKNELYAVGTYHYPSLKPHLEAVGKKSSVALKFGYEGPNVSRSDDWTSQSDHFAFHQAKIPFIYFGVENHKDYHQPTDDFENINQAFFVKATETVLAAVKSFDANLSQIEKQKQIVP